MKVELAVLLLLFQLFCCQSSAIEVCKDLYVISETTAGGVAWGYINQQGKVIAPPNLLTASDFQDNVAIITLKSKKNVSINSKNQEQILSGIIDVNGKIRLLPNINLFSDFSEGLALAQKHEKWVFINKSGKVIIAIPDSIKIAEESPIAFGFEKGVAGINTSNGVCLVTKKGKFNCRKNIFGSIGFMNEAESVLVEEGFTIIDKKGLYLIPPQDNPINFSEDGYFLIETKDRKWIYYDSYGKKMLEVPYNYAGLFSQELALVQINGKWGFMDKTGNLSIVPQFEDANNFGEDKLAAVKINNKYGFINQKGEFMIAPVFDYVNKPFSCGIAQVQKEGFIGYINKKGEWVWKKRIEKD
jgi:hypothetical protein